MRRWAGRSTRSRARAGCRAWPSSSTARSTCCPAPTRRPSGGLLQTTVPVVPDAPIGNFHLTIFGGKRGYLINTRSLCGAVPIDTVEYTAQNGKTMSQKIKVGASCPKVPAKRPKR